MINARPHVASQQLAYWLEFEKQRAENNINKYEFNRELTTVDKSREFEHL